MSDEHRQLLEVIRQQLPESAVAHIDRATAIASRAAAGNPMFVVESYDREYRPLKANVGSDGDAIVIYVSYDDGRWHKERWTDGHGEIVDGQHHQPQLWAASFEDG